MEVRIGMGEIALTASECRFEVGQARCGDVKLKSSDGAKRSEARLEVGKFPAQMIQGTLVRVYRLSRESVLDRL